jgi:3-oxoacyl-[acyl-carrier-protein] synthase III
MRPQMGVFALDCEAVVDDGAPLAPQPRRPLPRRLDPLSALSVMAASAVLDDSVDPHALGLYFATALGPLSATMEYLKRLREKGARRANPIDFPNLLMSSAAANVSLTLGIKGEVVTLHQGALSGLFALAAAREALSAKRISHALVVCAEEASAWGEHMEKVQNRPVLEAGAAALRFSNQGALRISGLWLHGTPDGAAKALAAAGIVHTPIFSSAPLRECASLAASVRAGSRAHALIVTVDPAHGSGALLLERV